MLHLTQNEKIAVLALAAVIACGSVIKCLFQRFPSLEDRISSPGRFIYKTNINTASKEELIRVPFIGEVSAQAIVQYRLKKGKILSFEELKTVPGIHPRNYLKMRPYLSL